MRHIGLSPQDMVTRAVECDSITQAWPFGPFRDAKHFDGLFDGAALAQAQRDGGTAFVIGRLSTTYIDGGDIQVNVNGPYRSKALNLMNDRDSLVGMQLMAGVTIAATVDVEARRNNADNSRARLMRILGIEQPLLTFTKSGRPRNSRAGGNDGYVQGIVLEDTRLASNLTLRLKLGGHAGNVTVACPIPNFMHSDLYPARTMPGAYAGDEIRINVQRQGSRTFTAGYAPIRVLRPIDR